MFKGDKQIIQLEELNCRMNGVKGKGRPYKKLVNTIKKLNNLNITSDTT